jgi:hypothetical protein
MAGANRALIGPLLAVALVGCIFVVDPPDGDASCRFAGSDTPCGKCIAANCQVTVDACCADAACIATIDELDRCASDTRNCQRLRDATTPIRRAELGFCVDRLCGDACASVSTTSRTHCRRPPFGERICECDVDGPPNDFECSRATFANTICCASAGWPASGHQCICRPLTCFGTAEGCSCYPASSDPARETCEGPPCCQDDERCTCGTACIAGQTPIPSCDIRHVGCEQGQKRVESCSLPAP